MRVRWRKKRWREDSDPNGIGLCFDNCLRIEPKMFQSEPKIFQFELEMFQIEPKMFQRELKMFQSEQKCFKTNVFDQNCIKKSKNGSDGTMNVWNGTSYVWNGTSNVCNGVKKVREFFYESARSCFNYSRWITFWSSLVVSSM